MVRKSDGTLFIGYDRVRVLSNPEGAKHPDGDRLLLPGDIFTSDDALNGKLYWCNRNCLPMQSISVECVERIA